MHLALANHYNFLCWIQPVLYLYINTNFDNVTPAQKPI